MTKTSIVEMTINSYTVSSYLQFVTVTESSLCWCNEKTKEGITNPGP